MERLPTGTQYVIGLMTRMVMGHIVGVALYFCFLTPLFAPLASSNIRVHIGVVCILMVPVFILAIRYLPRGLCVYLDAHAAGEDIDDKMREAAFTSAMTQPKNWAVLAWAAWVGCTGYFYFAFPYIEEYITLEYRVTNLCGGFSSGIFALIYQYILATRYIAPLRERLAAEIPDSARRAELFTPTTLSAKLVISSAGLVLVTVFFVLTLGNIQRKRSVEDMVVQIQVGTLESLERRVAQGVPLGQAFEESRALLRSSGIEFILLDGETGAVLRGSSNALREREIAALLDLDSKGKSDSGNFISPAAFSWRSLSDGEGYLVAVTRQSTFEAAAGRSYYIPILTLVLVLASVLIGTFVGKDLSRSIQNLRGELQRVAFGDLSRGPALEADDELGELARSIEAMSESLRDTLSRVRSAVDHVEGTAITLADTSQMVSATSSQQAQGVEEISNSIQGVNEQIQGISGSSDVLETAIEDSSSAVEQLEAVSSELQDNAVLLAEQAANTMTSAEEIARTQKQVQDNTELLAGTVHQASAHLERLSETVQQVDETAASTVEISRRVETTAQQGREDVQKTIDGMVAIREATDTAERVVTNLRSHVQQIGAIIEVIDNVADETNLLALNAAIIAAQAGEHGRSFSVVADEIKDLADRVLSQTKEIAAVIKGVEDESSKAVGAITLGTQSVQSGVELSQRAGESLEQITSAAQESAERTSEIVTFMGEQTLVAREVIEFMGDVLGGVDQIKRSGEEHSKQTQWVLENSISVGDVAAQVNETAKQQSKSTLRISESTMNVQKVTHTVNEALQEQADGTENVMSLASQMSQQARSNEDAARNMDEAMRGLLADAETLRDQIRRFKIQTSE